MSASAVKVTFPLTASGVIDAAGFDVKIVKALFGMVSESDAIVQVWLFAPRVILNGAKFSCVQISVSADCVKYSFCKSKALTLYKVPTE